jgi:hypothetical protein
VLDMENTQVKEVMKPRVDVVAIDASANVSSLFELIESTRYSRIPVYEGSVDNIIGVARAQSLLGHAQRWGRDAADLQSVTVKQVMEATDFIPQTMAVMSALKVRARRRRAERARERGVWRLARERAWRSWRHAPSASRLPRCARIRGRRSRTAADSTAPARRLLCPRAVPCAGDAQAAAAHADHRGRVRRHRRHRHARGQPARRACARARTYTHARTRTHTQGPVTLESARTR